MWYRIIKSNVVVLVAPWLFLACRPCPVWGTSGAELRRCGWTWGGCTLPCTCWGAPGTERPSANCCKSTQKHRRHRQPAAGWERRHPRAWVCHFQNQTTCGEIVTQILNQGSAWQLPVLLCVLKPYYLNHLCSLPLKLKFISGISNSFLGLNLLLYFSVKHLFLLLTVENTLRQLWG